ncbi:ATP synthase subunit epsilon, mitochondrial isoform X2 [Brassica napus]|uniref:ATP synthase subunit epsilon, mitochondrial isoform X2 n=1 Tax=Brassica napus TaxID=3708 RepID=UPI0020793A8F|nr:ATP synthase subunit epsilon, mitochondrial isoform X2 [Brassica napus]
MASTAAAVPFWRAVGMTYITYSNICANRVRNCLKEPFKAESMSSEKVHFSLSRWADGKPHKPALELYSGSLPPRRSHGKLSTLCRYHFL